MKKYFQYFTIIIFSFAISCKKNATTDQPVVKVEPTATAVGTIDGTAVTQTIGADGGKIISTDGILELTIPAGALTSNTAITVQPIKNTAPNGNGKGYRCLPNGLHFEKDITIQFHYTNEALAATRADWMSIAFQNAQKYWQVVQHIQNDSTKKIISASVNHFTDFVTFDALHIEPATWYMKPGESVTLQVFATDMIGHDDSVLVGMVKNNPVTWSANGKEGGDGTEGNISAVDQSVDGGLKAKYTAPANAPPKNPVTISAALKGSFRINGTSYNKVILTAAIYIAGKRYKVEFEYESAMHAAGDEYILKDKGNYNVNITGNTGIVTEFVNPPANIQKISGNCSSISYNGPGIIDILPINFMQVYVAGGYVQVSFDDRHTIQGPTFAISPDCNGGTGGEIATGTMPAITGTATFKDNNQVQVIDGSAGGVTLIITVTPIQ
ncbi:MAG: hypothetical protein QM802_13580 [Agriterribacter sp.]